MDREKTSLSDAEILAVEMDLLWGPEAGPELVLACARDGVRARIGKQVPTEVARIMAAEVEGRASAGEDLAAAPAQLERWRVVLEDALGAAVRVAPNSGPAT